MVAGARHPARGCRKYFELFRHHIAEENPINIFKNEATLIDFSENTRSKGF
jgi:hypothetical protein